MEYRVKLSQFEGPLDLLLHLVGKAKIDLKDIFVSQITEQYLQHMEEINELDMDRASDFLNMAANLLFIKSRSLLPVKRDEPEDGIDPEQELIERLRAYQLYKEAGKKLSELEGGARDIFYKLPEELYDEQEIVIEGVETDDLYLAFLEILQRKKAERPEPEKVEIHKDSFSIRAKKADILSRLRARRSVTFSELFERDASAMEMAVTFIALLELWHVRKITVEQRRQFADIMLSYCEGEE